MTLITKEWLEKECDEILPSKAHPSCCWYKFILEDDEDGQIYLEIDGPTTGVGSSCVEVYNVNPHQQKTGCFLCTIKDLEDFKELLRILIKSKFHISAQGEEIEKYNEEGVDWKKLNK